VWFSICASGQTDRHTDAFIKGKVLTNQHYSTAVPSNHV